MTLDLLRLGLRKWKLMGIDGGRVGLHGDLIGGAAVRTHFKFGRADRVMVLKQQIQVCCFVMITNFDTIFISDDRVFFDEFLLLRR